MTSEPLAYRIPEAAAMVGLGRTKLLEEIGAGHIKTVRVGRRVLVTRAELERYMKWLTKQ